MRTIEKKLQAHKQSFLSVQAPPELEGRLRHALENVPVKRRRSKALPWVASAAAALMLIAGIYQYPAFAYYGAKLLDRNALTSLSFSEVEEHGYGQSVNKSKTFDDGTAITVNGVIADDNAFIMYYSIDLPQGTVFDPDDRSFRYNVDALQGFLTDSDPKEGSGTFSPDGSQYKGIYKFEPVSPFSRTLTATFSRWEDSEKRITYPISFQFEANKAMKSIIKQKLSISVPVDLGTVHFDFITASPSSTIVRGYYDLEIDGHPRFTGKTKLFVNGTEVKSWGMRSIRHAETELPGFELDYDVLPTDQLESLELVLTNFQGYQQVEKPISLASPSDQSIRIGDEKLWIRSVTETDGGYDIVIASKQFTILDKDQLSIQAGGSIVPVSSISNSRPWDLNNGNILWEQTYSFNTTDKPEQLLLPGFYYIKTYDHKVSIPVHIK
ncbi:DUF4179 domain-containing protein [Paenibacillus sp. FSL M8-0334]|uniref:DUF4179 domain-containing protein n=1 Tax=Paenibacillus sp. FSL M8-0334 TaxID=2921623 RepID=UPI0030F514F1